MLRLAKHNTVPPGGYYYQDPDTKREFKGLTMQLLVQQAANHRLVNKLTVSADYPKVVEDWLCQQMPKGICVDEYSGHDSGRRPHDAYTALRGTYTLGLIMKKGNFGYVRQREAERRASICVNCRNNKPTGGCAGCRGIKNIISAAKRGRKTSLDEQLHVCIVGAVFNAVQVHLDSRTLKASTPDGLRNAFPIKCWRHNI